MDTQRHKQVPGANRLLKQNIWRDFTGWVDKNKCEGTCLGSRNQAHYFIPQGLLESYWTDRRVEQCLELLHIKLSVHIIKDELLHILSTLLRMSDKECSEVMHIVGLFQEKRVTDGRLPLSRSASRDCFRDAQTADRFYDTQFLFTPASLGRDPWDGTLEPAEVLPLKLLAVLQRGDNRSTPRIAKYQTYNGSSLFEKFLVIKEFSPSEVKSSYQAEINAYEAVQELEDSDRDCPERYFLDCKRAFRQGGRAAIIREYAEGRSLREWLGQNRIPYTPEGIRQLWSGLVSLYQALDRLHSAGLRGNSHFGSPPSYIHHDITPANIFVVLHPIDESPSSSRHGTQRISFKLGDLGLSRELQGMGDTETPQLYSPRNYLAPELLIMHGSETHASGTATNNSDLWSLSCLMLEVAVWLVGGSQAVMDFFQARLDENTKTEHRSPSLPSVAGHEGCFHDGAHPLAAVRDVRLLSDRNRRVFDGITGKIVDFILAHGLWNEPKLRGDAASTARRLQEIIDDPNNLAQPPSPTLPPSPAATDFMPDAGTPDWSYDGKYYEHCPGGPFGAIFMHNTAPARPVAPSQLPPLGRPSTKTQHQPSSPPISPAAPSSPRTGSLSQWSSQHGSFPPARKPPKHDKVTVDYVINYRNAWKWTTEADPFNAMHPFLADVKEVLDGRDQIFLIDDYSTMIPHAAQLRRTLEAIVKIVKSVDRDGMELRFASAPMARHTVRNAADLAGLLHSARAGGVASSSSSSSMAAAMRAILNSVLDKNATPASVPRHHLHHHHYFHWPSAAAAAQPTGTNIYVMTSGVWSQPDRREYDVTLGVARVIQDFIRSQRSSGRLDTHTVIQMVSFGHDPVGLERLRCLDDDLWSTPETGHDDDHGGGGGGDKGTHYWDIVDTKAHTECMWSILLGAMDKQEDDRPAHASDLDEGQLPGTTLASRSSSSEVNNGRRVC